MPAPQTDVIRREAAFVPNSIDRNSRSVSVTLSTEHAVDRGGFDEILSHAPGDVDLSRVPLPLIESHDAARLPIGVIEGVQLTGRKLRGIARFGSSARALEVFEDVADGIIRNVSIGYHYLDDGVPEGKRAIRFKFQPIEASAVAVGADPNAGFLRTETNMEQHQTRSARRSAGRAATRAQFAEVPREDRGAFKSHIRELELDEGEDFNDDIETEYRAWRVEAIGTFAEMHADMTCAGEIRAVCQMAELDDNRTVDSVRKEVLKIMIRHHQTEVHTGSLEMDNPGYGAGARVQDRYASLQHVTGKGAEQRAYRAGMWAKAIAGDQPAARYCIENGLIQQRALGTGVFSAGGALVPTAMENEIISLAETYGVFRSAARVWPMETGSTSIPVKTSGLAVASLPEGVVTPTSDPAFSNVNLTVKDVGGGTRVHRNLLADSPIALGDFIIGEFARAISEQEDANGFIGDGTSTYQGMRGLTTLLQSAAHAGGKIDAASAHDTFAEIDATDLSKLMGALPEYARAGAAWYLSATARDMIFTRIMMAAGGNNVQSLQQGVGERFMGYPVRVSQKMPAGAATTYNGSVIILFGNLMQSSSFGDRRGLQVDIDTSRYVEYREVYFQVTERFDIVNHHVGTTTDAGPVVGLAGKT